MKKQSLSSSAQKSAPNQPSKKGNNSPKGSRKNGNGSKPGNSGKQQKGSSLPKLDSPNAKDSRQRRVPADTRKPKEKSNRASKGEKGTFEYFRPLPATTPRNTSEVREKKVIAPLAGAYATDKVSDADKYQYDLCIKCWCGIVQDTCGRVLSTELKHTIQTFGLYSCIESADSFAKTTLSAIDNRDEVPQSFQMNALWSAIVAQCIAGIETQLESGDMQQLFGGSADIATAACCQLVLRFPKRFTIVKPDIRSAVAKFKEVHHQTVLYGRDKYRWPQSTIMEYLRHNLREMLIPRSKSKYEKIVKQYESTPGTFSSGSLYLNQAKSGWNPRLGDAQWKCSHCDRTACKVCKPVAGKKWEVFSEFTSNNPLVKWGSLLCDSDYLYTHSALYGYYPIASWPRTKYIHYDMNRDGHMKLSYPAYRKRDVLVSAVPKDYETSRMIAPETAYLNVESGRVRDLLIALATSTGAISYMPPEDQSLNRERARLGSYYPQDNPYVTKDLSHASDSISREFFFSVWPLELRAVTRNAISDYMIVDGAIRPTGMLATSGSRLTPICQSCFFLAILWTACDIAGEPRDVSVYNDDLICRQSVSEIVDTLLEQCGCTVNLKKSFVSGPFRESCGGEYLNGFDVTGVYWPRHAIRRPKSKRDVGTLEWLQTIVSMQHKLYAFPTVRQVLEEEVLSVIPDMTYSPVATDCDDLWAKWLDDIKSLHCEHYHVTSVPKPLNINDVKPELKDYALAGQSIAEFYTYIDWLRRGPSYPGVFSERAGISDCPASHPDQTVVQKLVKDKPLIRTTW